IDTSPAGGVILIQANRQDSEIIVSITDQGTDLPKEGQQKIFDHLLSTATQGGENLDAVGLAIAAGLVRLHEGRIWAESRAEGGATLAFSLPIA
ncbi:MAG: ATP-binding protein, partial [Alphaproteobacteria bacterium]|nr:ATP-binding protein [Alphaproteobacteria bacterium]